MVQGAVQRTVHVICSVQSLHSAVHTAQCTQWAVIGGQGGVSNILPYDPKYYTFLESLAQNIQI